MEPNMYSLIGQYLFFMIVILTFALFSIVLLWVSVADILRSRRTAAKARAADRTTDGTAKVTPR
jgi:hypothetical protein